jgi:glyoxylate reductase
MKSASNTLPEVFITRLIPEAGLRLLRGTCTLNIWLDEIPPLREEILKHVDHVEGILSLLTDQIDGEIMDAAGPNLKVISNHAVGVDNIDLQAATIRKIPVGNTPGILTETTADFAFALMMTVARRIVEADTFVHQNHWRTWSPSLLLGQDIAGATLGIVGYGRIGQAMAKRAVGFGMQVIYFDPLAKPDEISSSLAQPVDLNTLVSLSDFISIHTPLTDATYHLFDEKLFSLMKPTAIIINTARGAVVDPEALYHALKEHRIARAAIDVTDPEPISPDSPLLRLDNLIITPHIASASTATRDKMAIMAAENLIAGLSGRRLPNCVNPEVYSYDPQARSD